MATCSDTNIRQRTESTSLSCDEKHDGPSKQISDETDVYIENVKYDCDYGVADESHLHSNEEEHNNVCTKCMVKSVENSKQYMTQNRRPIVRTLHTTLVLFYFAYFTYACYYNFYNALALFIFTGLTLLYLMYALIRDRKGDSIYEKCMAPVGQLMSKYWYILKWIVYISLFVGLAAFIIVDTRHARNQLISAVGFCTIILFGYVFSKSPANVRWRPVLWGIFIQFLLGLFILRTYLGYSLFKWLGSFIAYFFTFSDYGAEFVFGESYEDHYFAFKVLPVIIYFSCVINILYYLGVMEFCVSKLAWILHVTMKTSAAESFNSAGNIFIGHTETVFLIRPFLQDLTLSELHAVMTGGFATMSGDAPGVYAPLGIDPMHILSASVMSAPAALGVSKLFYPELEKTKYVTSEDVKKQIAKPEERNIVDAAARGAAMAVTSVAYIAANLIAFVALLELFNAFLGWMGWMVGVPELSFELVCSYVFMPVAFLIGVEWADCHIVAELIGIKLFINEFVAYVRLAEIMNNGDIGEEPSISNRSEVIATYILCGFDNISSMGIVMGCLSSLVPDRKPDISKTITRALIAGSCTCFSTACIAGLLYKDYDT
ncbi:solute carrier family 28 member 3-like [Glandiceps talaboti]